MLNCNVVSVTIYHRHGSSDTVWFDTDLPHPLADQEAGQFRTRLPAGSAEEWVKEHLGVEPKVVDLDEED